MHILKDDSPKINVIKILLLVLSFISIVLTAHTYNKLISAEKRKTHLVKELGVLKDDHKRHSHEKDNIKNNIALKQEEYNKKLKNAKIAYLTFDDGPSNNTPKILDILKQHNVKATFFIIDSHNHNSETLIKRMAEEGHTIGNHTATHQYKDVYSSIDNFKNDVKKLDDKIEKITNLPPSHILRFPGGSNNTISNKYGGPGFMNKLVKEMVQDGYDFFDWNVDSMDASAYLLPKDKIVTAVLTQSKNHSGSYINVLMHDAGIKTTTVEALPEIIEGLKKQGFIFKPLTHKAPSTKFVRVD